MAVQRQQNFLGQQRVDVPHLRSLESSICADFDVLAGRILAGRSPLVSQGFVMVTTGVGQADQLQLIVADSVLIHHEASESGSIFHVPADRAVETLSATVSTRVEGSFTPNQVNYVGVDLVRSTDQSTNDLAMFIDTTSLTETPREVPMARTLDYVIIISTTDFSSNPNIAPIAKVTTGSNNAVVSVEDARNIAWRLGMGGAVPNVQNAFPWPAGRNETSNADGFTGGDKAITSFKGWADAVMTRLWEQGGGEFWYSQTADRNVKIVRSGAVFTSTGEHFEWDGTHLHWKGLVAVFDNSATSSCVINNQVTDSSGLTNLADGECLFVDLDRAGGGTLTALKTTLADMGSPTVPGSRWVFAWRYGANIYTRDHGWAVGSSFKIATVAQTGTVRLSASDDGTGGALAPRVATCDSDDGYVIGAGLTRGHSGFSSDFFAGAGDIKLGGWDNDHSINASTIRSQDSFTIYGVQDTLADARATLEIANLDSNVAKADNQIARFMARNEGSGDTEYSVTVDSNGAIGFRNVFSTPVVRDAGGVDKIKSKLYFTPGDASFPQPTIKYADGNAHPVAMNGGNTRARWEANALNRSPTLVGSVFEDFVGEGGTGLISPSGAGTAVYSTTERGGVLRLSTTASNLDAVSWQPSPDGTILPIHVAAPRTEPWDLVFRARLHQALSASHDTWMGLSGSGFDGLVFGATTLGFMNSAAMVVPTSWTPDTSWHVFRCSFDGTTIRVYVDNVLVLTDTSSVSTLGLNEGNLFVGLFNNTGVANNVSIDKAFCAFSNP